MTWITFCHYEVLPTTLSTASTFSNWHYLVISFVSDRNRRGKVSLKTFPHSSQNSFIRYTPNIMVKAQVRHITCGRRFLRSSTEYTCIKVYSTSNMKEFPKFSASTTKFGGSCFLKYLRCGTRKVCKFWGWPGYCIRNKRRRLLWCRPGLMSSPFLALRPGYLQ